MGDKNYEKSGKQTNKKSSKKKILHIDKAGSGEAGGVWRSRYRNGWDVGENRTVQGGGRERTDIFAARGPTGHAAPATWRRTVIALVFLDYNSHADNWFAKGGHDLTTSERNERSNSSNHHF